MSTDTRRFFKKTADVGTGGLENRRWEFAPWADCLVVIASSLLICIAVALLGEGDYIEIYCQLIMEHPSLFLLNLLPILIITAGLYMATGRSVLSALVAGGIFISMAMINSIKIAERLEPFYPSDIRLIREVLSIAGQYGAGNLIAILGMVVAVVLLGALAIRHFASAKRSKAVRVAGPLACAGILLSMVFTIYADTSRYDSYGTAGSRVVEYGTRGFVYSFIHNITTLSMSSWSYDAEYFDGAEAASIIASDYEVRPNVIMIMGEAFSEVTEDDAFDYTNYTDPMENFKEIAQDSVVYGHLLTDVFGGGTSYTEFSVLTGISASTMSDTTQPYAYVTNETDSLARLMGDIGYNTLAVHPGDGWYYSRDVAYEMLGFDDFVTNGSSVFANVMQKGGFISEEATMDVIISLMEENEAEDDPLFLFSVTIQNHGGYLNKYRSERQSLFETDLELSDEDINIMENYIYGMLDVDEQLGRLVEYMEGSDEPYILIYFGDHNPSLSVSIYEALGWGNPYGDAIDAIDCYTVPFIIWQNEAAREMTNLEESAAELGLTENVKFSPFYLGTTVMELLGYDKSSGFYQYVNSMRDEFPVLRSYLYRMADEDYTTTVPENEFYEKYYSWCYYKLYLQYSTE